MSTEDLKSVIVAVGGDVNDLPDNLITTHIRRLCEVLGVDTSDMTDNLISSYLKKIIKEYGGAVEPEPEPEPEPAGQWLLMAVDGVTCKGEAIQIPGMNSMPLEIPVLTSESNKYRVTIDGDEYPASMVRGENFRRFTVEGYNGPIDISSDAMLTTVYLGMYDTSTAKYHAIKLERWVE